MRMGRAWQRERTVPGKGSEEGCYDVVARENDDFPSVRCAQFGRSSCIAAQLFEITFVLP